MGVSASPSMVRVLVVDDSFPFREAAHELIDRTAGFEWIGEAESGEDGVDLTRRLRPDLVVMDVRMPGIGGIEAASRIASDVSPPVVVLITGSDLPAGVADGTVAEILGKHQLNRKSLQRAWETHCPR